MATAAGAHAVAAQAATAAAAAAASVMLVRSENYGTIQSAVSGATNAVSTSGVAVSTAGRLVPHPPGDSNQCEKNPNCTRGYQHARHDSEEPAQAMDWILITAS